MVVFSDQFSTLVVLDIQPLPKEVTLSFHGEYLVSMMNSMSAIPCLLLKYSDIIIVGSLQKKAMYILNSKIKQDQDLNLGLPNSGGTS